MKFFDFLDWFMDIESIIDMFRHPKSWIITFSVVAIVLVALLVIFK